MSNPKIYRFTLLLAFVALLLSPTVYAFGQNTPGWDPIRHVTGYLDDTFPPVLVADQNGTVHAFTTQWVGDEVRQIAIVYRQWSQENGWTIPVDIILPPSNVAKVLGIHRDPSENLHLIFQSFGPNSANIYYSHAPTLRAGEVSAWSTPIAIGNDALNPASGAIVGDDQGNLVTIFNGMSEGNGVYTTQSSDNGETWSDPTPIFLTKDIDLSPYSLQMIKDGEGQLHAVWNVVDSTGVDLSLHYSSREPNSQEWRETIELDRKVEQPDFFGPSFPRLVSNGKKIIVVYNSGNTLSGSEVALGRPVMRVVESLDGGIVWNEPQQPFPRHLGRSGSHGLVIDSNETVHVLFIQRIEPALDGQSYAPIAGIWHSQLFDSFWTEPDRLDLGELSGHDLSVIVSQGNQLLVTMREDPGVAQIGIFYSSLELEAPELPRLLPSTSTIENPKILETPTSISSTPTPTPVPNYNFETPPSGDVNPSQTILLGMVPLLLVLAGIIVFRLYLHQQHH